MDLSTTYILVVDDDAAVRDYLQTLLRRQGYQTETAADAATALVMLQEKNYALALVDVRMPGIDGIALLREIQRTEVDTEVIILTGYGTIENAVEAMRLGAYDYLTKPPDTTKLCLVVAKALEKARLQRQNAHLRVALKKKDSWVQLLGESPAMQQVRQLIDQVATVDSTVLIQGATGTGKELVARTIHQQSNRRSELFLALNCAAVPESLLASELFGHEKNAFTGASQTKMGIFEAADQGTILLDELSEMSHPMQVSLLRTLESGEFRRVGSNHTRYTNARVIAATNKDLQAEVNEGRFRSDLFFRLHVVTIDLPPLQKRKEDIVLLVHHFLAENVRCLGKTIRGFTDDALQILENYEWPGNVRELRNVIERAVLLCTKNEISPTDLHLVSTDLPNTSADYSENWTLTEIERYHIQRVFERNEKRRDATAAELGISVRTLYRKLRRYNIIEDK